VGWEWGSFGKARPCVAPIAAPWPTMLTFLTVLPFVARGAHTVPVNAGAVATAGRVDALIHGDVTLGAFPATVALARSFGVLSVSTAQDGAGGCKTQDRTPAHKGPPSEGLCQAREGKPVCMVALLTPLDCRLGTRSMEVQSHLQINNHKIVTDNGGYHGFHTSCVPGTVGNTQCAITD
jgi:hypothetical protein